jgi:putative transport protein
VLHFIKEFGLVLFVFTVGIQVGPGFFRSLRSEGLLFNILAGCLVLGGVAIAAFHTYVFDIPTEVMVGLLSGAVTNTPGLGAAQQSLQEILGPQAAQSAGAAYAVAYPFGIMGIILAAIFIKFLFKISPDTEQEQFDQELQARTSQLQVKNICILNPNLANKSIQELIDACKDRIVISRILHSSPSSAAPQNPNNEPNWSPINEVLPAEPNHILQINDVLLAVGTQSALNHLVLLAGGEANIDLRQTAGRMASKKVLITCKAVTKQSLQDLNLVGRYRANLTRIIRSGVQFTPVPNMQLHLGDIVTVVAPEQDMEIVVNELGNTPKDLHHPNMLLLFIGISAGLLLGSIAIPIPGLPTPVKLGMAGGPLVVALIMGRLGKVGSLNMYLHPGANLVLREMGILLFLACVGLGSGKSFIPALLGENGLAWVLMGASITFIPVFTVG